MIIISDISQALTYCYRQVVVLDRLTPVLQSTNELKLPMLCITIISAGIRINIFFGVCVKFSRFISFLPFSSDYHNTTNLDPLRS